MATVILRPSAQYGPSGLFNNESGSGWSAAKINDSSNSTYIYNAAQNQDFTVAMDNTSGLSGATFNNFVVTAIFLKHSAKQANGKFEVEIGDSSSITTFGSIADTVFVTTNTTATTISATAINFGGSVSNSDVDDMRLTVTTTSGNQSSLAEIYVTVDYTEASGYGHDVNSVGSSSIGKVNTVATASIGKVNSVD